MMRAPGWRRPSGFGGADHVADDTVLDAAGGVGAFELGEEAHPGPGAEVSQLDERSIADGGQDIVVVHGAAAS